MGAATEPVKILNQIEGLLGGIMQSDAAWCRQRIKTARRQIKTGKPADAILQSLIDRCTASAQKCQQRKLSLPKPDYDSALPVVCEA
jgi:hypothetical protein